MPTSKPQRLLLRFIVLLAICASISLWPAIPKRGAIVNSLASLCRSRHRLLSRWIAASAITNCRQRFRGWSGAPVQVSRSTATRQNRAAFMSRS